MMKTSILIQNATYYLCEVPILELSVSRKYVFIANARLTNLLIEYV